MKQPLSRRIHARRRGQIQRDDDHIAHINQACAAQPHQRKRIEEEIRIEDGGQRAISVVGFAAQPHGNCPSRRPLARFSMRARCHSVSWPRFSVSLSAGAGSDQHRYTDRQQNARVIRFHAARRIQRPEHAQRQRKERQCPFVVGVGGQIDAKIPDTQELARRKLEFELHVFAAFRQRQLNIAFPFARRQHNGAWLDGRAVVAEHMQHRVAVVFRHPVNAIFSRRKVEPRPLRFPSHRKRRPRSGSRPFHSERSSARKRRCRWPPAFAIFR